MRAGQQIGKGERFCFITQSLDAVRLDVSRTRIELDSCLVNELSDYPGPCGSCINSGVKEGDCNDRQ